LFTAFINHLIKTDIEISITHAALAKQGERMGLTEQQALAQRRAAAEPPHEAQAPQPQPTPFHRELQEKPVVAAPAQAPTPYARAGEYPLPTQTRQYPPAENSRRLPTAPSYEPEGGANLQPRITVPRLPEQGRAGLPNEGNAERYTTEKYYGDENRRHFDERIPFGPPAERHWGWQNPDAWSQGYDTSFFQQDPNFAIWQPTIQQEAQSITSALDAGATVAAANELNADLWAMRGDLYGQNELLTEVHNQQNGEGAQLYLGQWDPMRGTWDNMEVESPAPPPGYQPDPSYRIQTYE
jgi:hypothetical protein